MLGSIPHQKNLFLSFTYSRTSRNQAWGCRYVTNVSIIFDCSMLLYYLFWMFTGFIMLFYMIFGTNLLTQSPVPVSVFPCFRVSQKRKIKRSPIDLKLHGTYFWTRRNPEDLECTSGGSPSHPRDRGACPGGQGAPSTLVDGSGLFWPNYFTPGLLLVHKNHQKLACQLDSVWYYFSVKLKNKEKTETGTGLQVNRLVPKII